MPKIKNRRLKGEGYFTKQKNAYIYKLPVGKYENNRTKYLSFSGASKQVAIERAMNYKIAQATTAMNRSVAPKLKDYITSWLRISKKDANAVRPQTYTRMCSVVDNQIIPTIGDYRITELTKTIIQSEMLNPLLNEVNQRTGVTLSVSTVRKALVHLKDCLNQAVDDGILARNPCRGIKIGKNITQKKSHEVRFFDDEEIERFVGAARATTLKGTRIYKYGELFVLDIYTGLRIGEMLALRKKDVDLSKRKITVRAGMVNYFDLDKDSATYRKSVVFCVDQTKTNNGCRDVFLNAEAFKIVQKMMNRCEEDNDFLVTGCSKTLLYSNVLRTYKKICMRAGLENPNGIHTLRHTCASLMFRRGIDVKVVSDLLGHASVAFTYDTYIHLVQAQTEESLSQISGSVSERNHKELVAGALQEGLTKNTISQLLAIMPVETFANALAEIC